jgi:diguanylate cyclase (GGDEF)-like protein
MDLSAYGSGTFGSQRSRMGSFKLRLVIYFMLLALLPLVAATVAFSEVAERGETGSTDSRLSTAIRVAVADYEEQLEEDTIRTARSLARATQVQEALDTLNRSDLVRLAKEVEHSAFYSPRYDFLAGDRPGSFDGFREVPVKGSDNERLGSVVVHIPFDDELAERLASRAALDGGDHFAFVANDRVIAPKSLTGDLGVPHQQPRFVTVDGVSYRALGTDLIAGDSTGRPPVALVALSPKAVVDQAVRDLRSRFLLFSAVALVAVGILAYTFGRTIVRSLGELAAAAGAIARGKLEERVPVRGRDEFAALGDAFNDMAAQLEQRLRELDAERARVRDTIGRFGDALAATHEPYALLPVIVQNTVAATGAAGARLLVNGKEIAREGNPADGGKPLAIPLGLDGRESGVLFLTPKEADFSDEARELAHWLGSQASIALENARLHRLVERQANTDGLTELPNRRHFEEALDVEISRAERFSGSLALILADLDDFKQVNDRYGHQAGDDVLQTFADILRTTVREIDLPARYGGEEFAVLLPQTDLDGAHQLAERLRRALAARPMSTHPGGLVAVTASFGVAAFPDAPTPAALFASADEALYQAKRAGKNCVVSADAGTIVRAHD